ncbi:hypothetical protein G7Y79_00014g037290 [Physcia stellaris]|nr:hypothetical protein G7Y79_00014g037290 [Physcia stellaris]
MHCQYCDGELPETLTISQHYQRSTKCPGAIRHRIAQYIQEAELASQKWQKEAELAEQEAQKQAELAEQEAAKQAEIEAIEAAKPTPTPVNIGIFDPTLSRDIEEFGLYSKVLGFLQHLHRYLTQYHQSVRISLLRHSISHRNRWRNYQPIHLHLRLHLLEHLYENTKNLTSRNPISPSMTWSACFVGSLGHLAYVNTKRALLLRRAASGSEKPESEEFSAAYARGIDTALPPCSAREIGHFTIQKGRHLLHLAAVKVLIKVLIRMASAYVSACVSAYVSAILSISDPRSRLLHLLRSFQLSQWPVQLPTP